MSAYVNLLGVPSADPAIPPELPRPLPEYRVGGVRRLAMLLLLGGYILSILIAHGSHPQKGPALPGTTGELGAVLAVDFFIFAVVMALAVWLGRPSWKDLYANHAPSPLRWLLGLLWSVTIRFGLGGVVVVVAAVWQLFRGNTGTAALEEFQPKVENLLPLQALKDPIYLLVVCTGVSFVVAGLREELWRAGVIFAMASLLPKGMSRRARELTAVVLAAFVFGAGHLVQGVGGMVLAGILGLLLGLIMVWRRSFWEAVLAHGFFDATTFLMLRLLLDRALLEDSLNRAGVPPETVRRLLEELGKKFGY